MLIRRLCVLIVFAHGSLVPSATASSTDDGTYAVPSFSLADLLAGRRLDSLATTLGHTGLLAVTGFAPGELQKTREAALSGLCSCGPRLLSVDGSDTASSPDDDGETERVTVATATVGSTPLPLSNHQIQAACENDGMAEAMETLRDHVAEASRAFVGSLDLLLTQARSASDETLPPLLRVKHDDNISVPFDSVTSVVQSARHLEHFHLYSKNTNGFNKETKALLGTHTDAGLFLAFVPSRPCEGGNNDFSFLVSVRGDDDNEVLQRAVFPPNSIGIMLGAGAEHWIEVGTSLLQLRATKHAVRMNPGERRAWYGMMHLVPEKTIVQNNPLRTFADMQKAMTATSTKSRYGDANDASAEVSIGCGVSQSSSRKSLTTFTSPRERRRVQHVDDGSACNNVTNFYCWMMCLEVPDADRAEGRINEGQSLYCLDPTVLAATGNKVSSAVQPCYEDGVPGKAMNSLCQGSWQPTAPGVYHQVLNLNVTNPDEEPFCYGGTSMYMDGFQWVGEACVIYLFPQWVLSSEAKLAGACIGTLFFGVALEGVIRGRRLTVKRIPAGYGRLAASASSYGLQLTMGYFLMLVVMTYSGPLFLCVVVGLMMGHVVFNRKALLGNEEKLSVPEGSTPCCQNDLGQTTRTRRSTLSEEASLSNPEATLPLVERNKSSTGAKRSCCTLPEFSEDTEDLDGSAEDADGSA